MLQYKKMILINFKKVYFLHTILTLKVCLFLQSKIPYSGTSRSSGGSYNSRSRHSGWSYNSLSRGKTTASSHVTSSSSKPKSSTTKYTYGGYSSGIS